jgi:hypothetical protein
MAKLFDTNERVVPTWLAAARYLDGCPGREALNLVLEIADPLSLKPEDHEIMKRVDQALEPRGLNLRTVAGTIFPLDMYRRHGRNYRDKYLAMLKRGKQTGTWGTYAERMIDRPGKTAGERINPLDTLIERLKTSGQPKGKSFASAYELGVADPAEDLAVPDGGDVPTYNPALDGREWLGFPCLSHVSFKRMKADSAGHALHMTAIYRSHHYCARALGNLLGLAQLLSFVAKESGLQVGSLSCVSSYAELDVSAWGGVGAAKKLLA